jgi:hypothetical protein
VFAAEGLTLRVGDTDLLVSGARPGASVRVIGVTREPRGFTSLMRTHALPAVTADARGDAAIPYGAAVPATSLWVAVDGATGSTAAAAPAATPVRQFTPAAAAPADRVAFARTALELLVVRPGAGAWAASAHEGGRGDGDRAVDGKITLVAAELEPVGGKDRLSGGFRAGDVVVVLDPHELDYAVIRISGSGR